MCRTSTWHIDFWADIIPNDGTYYRRRIERPSEATVFIEMIMDVVAAQDVVPRVEEYVWIDSHVEYDMLVTLCRSMELSIDVATIAANRSSVTSSLATT